MKSDSLSNITSYIPQITRKYYDEGFTFLEILQQMKLFSFFTISTSSQFISGPIWTAVSSLMIVIVTVLVFQSKGLYRILTHWGSIHSGHLFLILSHFMQDTGCFCLDEQTLQGGKHTSIPSLVRQQSRDRDHPWVRGCHGPGHRKDWGLCKNTEVKIQNIQNENQSNQCTGRHHVQC